MISLLFFSFFSFQILGKECISSLANGKPWLFQSRNSLTQLSSAPRSPPTHPIRNIRKKPCWNAEWV